MCLHRAWNSRICFWHGGQLLSQALLRIYGWIASSYPHSAFNLLGVMAQPPKYLQSRVLRGHGMGLRAWRRLRPLPTGMSRDWLLEAGAHLAGLGLCGWRWALMVLIDSFGCWSWLGAHVLLITQVSRVDSWSVRSRRHTLPHQQKNSRQGGTQSWNQLSLNNWQQGEWREFFFPYCCCCRRKSLRFRLISALRIFWLWVTALIGKQEPWVVQIRGDDRSPMLLLGFSGEGTNHIGESAVEMSNPLS